ncbi:conserved hypothetical protein [Enterobacterales bacterium 8AC]|nr:conserved hypothetical protein [Enterobacterales bacterium 8AC]
MTISKAVSIATERENIKREAIENMHVPASIRQNQSKNSITRLLTVLTLLLMSIPSFSATTVITIGKNSGIVWEGEPFNVELKKPTYSSTLTPTAGLISISNLSTSCIDDRTLSDIDGYRVLKIAKGVGLIPRASANAIYRLTGGQTIETLTGTLGLPITQGTTSSGYAISNPISYNANRQHWCLPPRMGGSTFFYDENFTRTVRISGTWVMVTDGTQESTSNIPIPPMYAGSYATSVSGDISVNILPNYITLRISTLVCTVATTTNINFGGVQRNTQVGSELARLSYPLTVACSQDTDKINANINVQFRAASGQYEGTPTRLALTQGGGYITGEIDNGVTGSGACNLTTGIPFDNTQLKVGSISSVEATKITNNQITWRLCSGGATLPLGPVDASTDMLVTFN